MKKSLLAALMISTIAIGGVSQVAHADENNIQTTEETKKEAPAPVVPIFGKTQNENVTGHFYMKWTPGAEDTIGVQINNSTNVEQKYDVIVAKAVTNPNGIIVYDDNSSDKIGEEPRIQDMITGLPKEVTVKPHSSETIKTTIKFGDTNLNGYKLGGITIAEHKDPDKNKQFNQRMAYAIPVAFSGNEGTKPAANVKFEKFKVDRIGSGLYSITTPFVNENANWIVDGTVTATLKDKDGKKVLTSKTDSKDFNTPRPISLAPESKSNLRNVFSEDLDAGEYEMTVEITTNVGTWKDTQTIKISKDKEKDISETVNIGDKKKDPNIYLYLFLGLLVAIVGYITGKQIKKHHDKKKENK